MPLLRLLAKALKSKAGAAILLWVFQFLLKAFVHRRSRLQLIDSTRRSYYELTLAAFSLALVAFREPSSRFRATFQATDDLIWAVTGSVIGFTVLCALTYYLYRNSSHKFPREASWRDFVGFSISIVSLIVSFDAVGAGL